jgi:2-polyprenyl-6-methoxyphenol hydroxylase-like FAD-dependent oxidoreductase
VTASSARPGDGGRYDIVICGAGVAGLTLGRLLGDEGRRVLVLERERAFRDVFKGEVLQPRALRILQAVGSLGALREHGALRADRFTAYSPDGRPVGDLPYAGLPGHHNHMLVHGFRDIQRALAENLSPTVEVRYGASVHGLRIGDDGRVTGALAMQAGQQVEIEATLTVACDGRGSKLRKEAGLPLIAQRYGHEFIGFQLDRMADMEPTLAAFTMRQGVVLFFPLPGDQARMYVQAECGVFRRRQRQDVPGWLDGVLRTVPALRQWERQVHAAAGTARILPIWRQRARLWTRPGFALAGDAAHCVHPIAAQGMSAAADDAWVLGAALGNCDRLTPAAVDAALACYEEVRQPRQDFIDRISHSLASLLTGTSASARALRQHELRVIERNERLRQILTYNMAGCGVRRFTARDRLLQIGLPDPRRTALPRLAEEPLPAIDNIMTRQKRAADQQPARQQ